MNGTSPATVIAAEPDRTPRPEAAAPTTPDSEVVEYALNRLIDYDVSVKGQRLTQEQLIEAVTAEAYRLHAALDEALSLMVGVYRANIAHRDER